MSAPPLRRCPRRPVSLVCLPPAGGSATMIRPWLGHLADHLTPVAVNTRRLAATLSPESRGRPPEAGGALRCVAQRIAAELPQGPYVLVGHSLGGLLAFEAARWRMVSGGRMPSALIVMASRPPTVDSARLFRPLLHADDDAFLDHMVELGAAPAELADSPARPLFLPPLRSDIALVCSYAPTDHEELVLDVPVSAWHGSGDPIAPPSLAAGWGSCTRGSFDVRTFHGSHDFPRELGSSVAAGVNAVVASVGLG